MAKGGWPGQSLIRTEACVLTQDEPIPDGVEFTIVSSLLGLFVQPVIIVSVIMFR